MSDEQDKDAVETEIKENENKAVKKTVKKASKKPVKKTEPKSLSVSNVKEAKEKVNDIKVVGDGDLFTVLSKASSESQGWMKSTKAMKVGTKGCIVQVTTQQRNPDGSYSVAEALTYVPGGNIVNDENGGKKLT